MTKQKTNPVTNPAHVLAVGALATLLAPLSLQAQSLGAAIADSRAALNEYVATSSAPGVSVAVVLGEALVWAEGFGLADVEHGVQVTPETLFRAWSISKPLTAAAAGLLHDRELLDLDAPISTYVPHYPDKDGHPITTRQLLGHRAGLPHYGPEDVANFVSYGSVFEALEKFKDRPLLFEPGTRFEYSSFGYNLVGAVVEAVAGVPFLEFMEAEVFEPLGMTQTRPDRHHEIVPNRTGFYALSEAGEVINAPFTNNSDLWPSGGFLSTPTDLVTFGAGLLRGDLLKPETVELLFTPVGPTERPGLEYGLGWYVISPENPRVGESSCTPGDTMAGPPFSSSGSNARWSWRSWRTRA